MQIRNVCPIWRLIIWLNKQKYFRVECVFKHYTARWRDCRLDFVYSYIESGSRWHLQHRLYYMHLKKNDLFSFLYILFGRSSSNKICNITTCAYEKKKRQQLENCLFGRCFWNVLNFQNTKNCFVFDSIKVKECSVFSMLTCVCPSVIVAIFTCLFSTCWISWFTPRRHFFGISHLAEFSSIAKIRYGLHPKNDHALSCLYVIG